MLADLAAAFGIGLLVGVLSALAGIGGGAVMVPFLYLMYSRTGVSLDAQTVAAHATSLGVAFVTAVIGTVRYARVGAIRWRPALIYGLPGTLSAFLAARVVAAAGEARWIRSAFGLFLIVSALDMIRRAIHSDSRAVGRDSPAVSGTSTLLLGLFGVVSGMLAGVLGVGGGVLAVPTFLYVARLNVKDLAPSALAAVCLATFFGVAGYLTAGPAPPVSPFMIGFVDFRMAAALTIGAAGTVPLGVRLQRMASPTVLQWCFAVLFAALGVRLAWQGFHG